MKQKGRVCVISTVHPDYDTRILKQCSTLQKYFFVDLVIQSKKKGTEKIEKDGLNFIPLPVIEKRMHRLYLMILALRLSFLKKYNYYIFHDPELIIVGIILKIFQRKVIYDIHEDYQAQIFYKDWIHRFLKKIVSFTFFHFERFCSKYFDSLICATPSIYKKFIMINKNTYCVRNFPPCNELNYMNTSAFEDTNLFKILYVGVISEERSIIKILDAIENIECEFILAGNFSPNNLHEVAKNHISWKKVRYLGYIDRKEFSIILREADLGILLFQPIEAHIESLPNKMFEYMAGGLYQLSSNFREWKEIIEENNIGETIDPEDTKELSRKIINLKNNRVHINELRPKIREVFISNFTWEREKLEFLKAFDVYE